MKKRLSLLLALVFCVSMLLTVAGAAEATDAEAKYKEEIIIGYASDLATADPCMDSSSQLRMVYNLTFSTLTAYDQATGILKPELATEWSSNPDCTVWTFKLRDDVKFHDGSMLDADDVIFTLNRATDGEQVKVPVSIIASLYDSAKALDPLTVEITLKSPSLDFPYVIEALRIYSKDAFDNGVENAGYIGCGPYKWRGQEIGVRYGVERFDDYFEGPAKTKYITFKVMPEIDSQIAALQAGEINFCAAVRTTDLPILEADPNTVAKVGPGATVYFWAWNSRREIANNKLVTDAVAYAIDKEALNLAMFSGDGSLVNSMTGNSASPGYAEVKDYYTFDQEKAKELLAEAGYGEGELELTIMYYAWCKPIAEMTQACLDEVGIVCKMREIDGSVFRAMAEEGEYDLTVTYCGLGASINYMCKRFFTSDGAGNWFGYVPTDEIQAQLDVCSQQSEIEGVLAESAKLQQMCADDTRYIPIMTSAVRYGFTADVEGFNMPMSTNYLDFASCYIVEK